MLAGGGAVRDSIDRKIQRDELSSGLFDKLFTGVFSDLESAGIKLNSDDEGKLRNGIESVGTIENRLLKLYRMLGTLSELASFYKKTTGCGPVVGVREISINQIRSNEELLDYLGKNIDDLQSCISANLGQQNSICGELVKHMNALLDTVSGRSNPDVVSA
jgi:Mg2+ and Co2+ transporter CorA